MFSETKIRLILQSFDRDLYMTGACPGPFAREHACGGGIWIPYSSAVVSISTEKCWRHRLVFVFFFF